MPIDCTVEKTAKGTPYVRSTSHGKVQPDELFAFFQRLAQEWPGLPLLAVVRRDASYPPETRRALSQADKLGTGVGALATALLFESAIHRAMVATVMVFIPARVDRPLKSCSTEAEACAWFDMLATTRRSASVSP